MKNVFLVLFSFFTFMLYGQDAVPQVADDVTVAVDTLPKVKGMPITFESESMIPLSGTDFLMKHKLGYYQFGKGQFNQVTGELSVVFAPAVTEAEAKATLEQYRNTILSNMQNTEMQLDSLSKQFFGNE